MKKALKPLLNQALGKAGTKTKAKAKAKKSKAKRGQERKDVEAHEAPKAKRAGILKGGRPKRLARPKSLPRPKQLPRPGRI